MSKALKVAVVGVTGAVGQEMLRVLEERNFPVAELVPVASARSAGRTVTFRGEAHTVRALTPEVFQGVDVALFSAGGSTSKEHAPVAAAAGAIVIDNSSAFRMDPDCPLCVPEVNLEAARSPKKGIIANPNCSTIQMVVALKPVHELGGLKRVVVSTYQAISGAGAQAIDAFLKQSADVVNGREPSGLEKLKGQLAQNLLMHWTVDAATGYQEEELKMVHETKKIFGDPSIQVSPTCVRVPVVSGHSESISVETHRPVKVADVRAALEKMDGVVVVDDFVHGVYPQPKDCVGKDPVFVGRIREDVGNPGGLQMWVVADNLRKGAATNAVQIAEGLFL
ncbi:MAG: aspartate-semialdehyde dehydrogenase [Myxococcales bacterium]|jgi:aspartate-semialdehyde dehydrogenase|nr:aspartate-semialdehyde dehydrogenase [Myxococcales bacterium]